METDFNKFSRFMKTVDRYRLYSKPVRTTDLKVHVFVGPPNSGKTKFVNDRYPDNYSFPIGKDLWSDGYMGQPVVLVDDFSGQMRLVDTLRFLDRYPIQIPKKEVLTGGCQKSLSLQQTDIRTIGTIGATDHYRKRLLNVACTISGILTLMESTKETMRDMKERSKWTKIPFGTIGEHCKNTHK